MVIVIALIVAILSAIPVYYIWNDIMPSLLKIRQISFGEALEISILCTCLFKSSSSKE